MNAQAGVFLVHIVAGYGIRASRFQSATMQQAGLNHRPSATIGKVTKCLTKKGVGIWQPVWEKVLATG